MKIPMSRRFPSPTHRAHASRQPRRSLLALGLLLALAACNDGAVTPTVSGPVSSPTQVVARPTATAPPLPNTIAPTDAPTAAPTAAPSTAPTDTAGLQFATPTDPPVATLSEDDTLLIYNLIAHDLVSESRKAAANKLPAYIGINPRPGKGELLDTDSSTQTIPDDLVDNMADLGTTVAFAPFMQAIGSLDDGGKVRDDGVYLTLGLLEPAGADIQIYASTYRARDMATGYRYTLQKPAGGPWTILQRQVVWDH